MNKIYISIIIPVYNAEKFIAKSLRSVQKQTLKNIEIIYVDDGSNDLTCRVIEKYMKQDNRIRLFRQKHAGPGAARNVGILKARGEYISFLDVDDYYYEEIALETMYKESVTNNASMCSSYRMIYERSNDIVVAKNFDYIKPQKSIFIDYKDILSNTGFTNYLYKRAFLVKNNIFFPEVITYEDPPFLANAISYSKNILRIPVVLYCAVTGYKSRIYDVNGVGELLDGIYSSLQIAIKTKWDNLYEYLMEQMNDNYYRHVAMKLTLNNVEKLIKIAKYNYKYGKGISLKVYDELVNGFELVKYENYVFPFSKVKKDSKVIIYGAGLVGRALKYQAQRYGKGYVEVVGVVDRNASKLSSDNFDVFLPSQLQNIYFDTVIITAKLEQTAQDIRNQLHKIGVADDCIIWQDDGYSKEKFYKNVILTQ